MFEQASMADMQDGNKLWITGIPSRRPDQMQNKQKDKNA